jgi:hypothetical protein
LCIRDVSVAISAQQLQRKEQNDLSLSYEEDKTKQSQRSLRSGANGGTITLNMINNDHQIPDSELATAADFNIICTTSLELVRDLIANDR